MDAINDFIKKSQEDGLGLALRAVPQHLARVSLSIGPDLITTPLTENIYSYDVENYQYSPNPHAPIYVSPNSVNQFTGREWPSWKNKKKHLGKVISGNWDINESIITNEYQMYEEVYKMFRAKSFEWSLFYKSLKKRFVQGEDWADTEFISKCLKLAENDIPSWKGLTSREEILKHCKEVDDLYKTIRNNGYESQLELGNIGYPRDVCREVCIDIGRDGELLFVNGRHRLAIAKILNINKIPVCVLVRHEEWMNKRSQNLEKNKKHPDTPF